MLGMRTYSKDYIAACRAKGDADVKAWKRSGAGKDLEPRFFNNMVLQLEYMFVHRLSGAEGKDGNPLNEVRVLCNSLLLSGGKLQAEKLPGWPNSASPGSSCRRRPRCGSSHRGRPSRWIRTDSSSWRRRSSRKWRSGAPKWTTDSNIIAAQRTNSAHLHRPRRASLERSWPQTHSAT
jgi:hypothetical protein